MVLILGNLQNHLMKTLCDHHGSQPRYQNVNVSRAVSPVLQKALVNQQKPMKFGQIL